MVGATVCSAFSTRCNHALRGALFSNVKGLGGKAWKQGKPWKGSAGKGALERERGGKGKGKELVIRVQKSPS